MTLSLPSEGRPCWQRLPSARSWKPWRAVALSLLPSTARFKDLRLLSPKTFFHPFPIFYFFVDQCQPSSLGSGQWLRAAWWGVEPRWQQVHHGYREGAWQKAMIGKLFSATIDIISLHKRWLFLMRMTWFQLHPSDPVRPAPWVQNVVAFSVSRLISSILKGEFCRCFCRAASALWAGCCGAVWGQLGPRSFRQVYVVNICHMVPFKI